MELANVVRTIMLSYGKFPNLIIRKLTTLQPIYIKLRTIGNVGESSECAKNNFYRLRCDAPTLTWNITWPIEAFYVVIDHVSFKGN